jgi:hypothetical protein
MSLTRDFTDMIVTRGTGKKLSQDITDLTTQMADIAKVLVNIVSYKLPNETDYNLALGRVFTAYPSGAAIVFPMGECIVNNVEIPSYFIIKGQGRDVTQIKRNADTPVFKVTGTPLPNGGTPSHWGIGFEDVTIGSNGTFSSDLTSFQGCTGMSFNRIRVQSSDCRNMYLNQVWDSRFNEVQFFDGGKTDGTSSLVVAGGLNGYKQSKELVFMNCHFEGYKGSAITTPRDSATVFKTDVITWINCKFESKLCTGNHVVFEANNMFFFGTYISTEFSTTDVIKMIACRGIIGKIRVGYAGTTVIPTSIINTDVNCFLFDLVLTVSESQPVNSNVWTYAAELPGLRLNAQYPVINNRTFAFSQIPVGSNTMWFDATGRLRTHTSKPTTDTSGYRIAREETGNTSQRPTSNLYQGRPYYDAQIFKQIYYDGAQWRDAMGTIV